MKALTIRQPWASLIALGVKHIETRSWRAPQSLIGQTIAIHAGASDATWRELESPALMSERSTIQAVLAALPGVMLDERSWCATAIYDEAIRFSGLDLELPLGAIVATATLADCLPMVDGSKPTGPRWQPSTIPCVEIDGSGRLTHWWHHDAGFRDASDQLPYGDFQPGRWAWMLADVQLCEPVPTKGKQGLWEVQS